MPGFLFLPPLSLSVVSSAVLWKVVGSRLDFFSNSSGSFFGDEWSLLHEVHVTVPLEELEIGHPVKI